MSRLFALSTFALLGGCYDEEEHITVRDLSGTVRIPISMFDDMTLERDDGTLQSVSGDYRMLGPVYIGVYASIKDGLYSYPHPEIGPVLDEDTEGNEAGPFTLTLDFLGKDSMRHLQSIDFGEERFGEVGRKVFENLKSFCAKKKPSADVFDQLTVCCT